MIMMPIRAAGAEASGCSVRSLAKRTSHHPTGLPTRLAAAALLGAAAAGAYAAPPATVDVAAADNAFGFRLLTAVQKTLPHANVVLSPVSAALDLSVALNGAEGQTRRQMLDSLSLGGSALETVNTANARLIKVLGTPAKNITLSVAESLWVDSRRAALRPEYVRQTQAWYDATMTDLDFSDPGAVAQINGWASQETHGRIPEVLKEIDPTDRAILLNAVYFKGEWAQRFDQAQTHPRDFTLAAGLRKQIPRMVQSGRFSYFETPALQAIRLPFGNGDLVMDILLPAKTSTLRALEAELTPKHWQDWQAHYGSRIGTLELPRFELRSRYRLNEALQSLGMTRAFEPKRAEFTTMFSQVPDHSPAERLFISAVLQFTYWKVNEEGAEAAAVTSINVRATAVARPEQPFRISVDRPFFCAIEDRRSGALLFIGAIYDPAP
jgi:serpin B